MATWPSSETAVTATMVNAFKCQRTYWLTVCICTNVREACNSPSNEIVNEANDSNVRRILTELNDSRYLNWYFQNDFRELGRLVFNYAEFKAKTCCRSIREKRRSADFCLFFRYFVYSFGITAGDSLYGTKNRWKTWVRFHRTHETLLWNIQHKLVLTTLRIDWPL